jgi:hypothetical protein
MNLLLNRANQFLILAKNKKELDISLSFKFDPLMSNYCKSIKLNFVSQNQDLTKRHNIFSTPRDPHVCA